MNRDTENTSSQPPRPQRHRAGVKPDPPTEADGAPDAGLESPPSMTDGAGNGGRPSIGAHEVAAIAGRTAVNTAANTAGNSASDSLAGVTTVSPVSNEHVRVALQDGERLRVPAIDALRMKLRAGCRLEPAQLEELRRVAQQSAMRDLALRLLGRREHSRRELAQKLEARYPGVDGIDSLLDLLHAQGSQSDERFARSTVRHRMIHSHHGPRRVFKELIQKGVSAEIAASTVDSEDNAQGWLHGAMRRLDIEIRRASKNAPTDWWRIRSALKKRGFTSSQIDSALAGRDTGD